MNQKKEEKKKKIYANNAAIANIKKKKKKRSRENVVQHRHCLKHLIAKKGGEKRGQPWSPTTRHYQPRPQHYYHHPQLGQPCTDHILV
jgi:hypothetical protein